MDVIFPITDIRKLLSAPDRLDDDLPLSAPELSHLIDHLKVRSLGLKSKLHAYVESHHSELSEIISICSQSASKSFEITDSVDELLHMLSNSHLDQEIVETAKQTCLRKSELEDKMAVLCFLRKISEFVNQIHLIKDNSRNGRLVEAAEELRDLKMVNLPSGSPIYDLLGEERRQCYEEVQEMFVRMIENVVVFDMENRAIKVMPIVRINDSRNVELQIILTAMEVAGFLEFGVANVADLVIKHVVVPLCAGECSGLIKEINKGCEGRVESILHLLFHSDSKVENLSAATIYCTLLEALKFCFECVCFQNPLWMQCFGKLMWSTILVLIINNFLSKAIPTDVSGFSGFQDIIKATFEFESGLKAMKFISDGDDEKISNYVKDVEIHFAAKKRNELLAQGRSLLLYSNFFIFSDGGETGSLGGCSASGQPTEYTVPLLLQNERRVVSRTAFRLMELVHKIVQDVCLSSTILAKELYHVARDILVLYEIIIPVKQEKHLDGINQVGVLIHNDCMYLAEEILGLVFQYRSDFPNSIKEAAIFVDLAPRFYRLAEAMIEKQVQLVIHSLNEAVDESKGFQNTHQMQQYESAKFGLEQVVFILEKVRIIWEPVLLSSAYKRAMPIVVNAVLGRITNDILQLDDLAAEETFQLHKLINCTIESLSPLFNSLLVNENASDACTVDDLDMALPLLLKIRKLADLLNMPLKSITESWERGELVCCGFTSSEVEGFIKATFADSPLRKDCLSKIRT